MSPATSDRQASRVQFFAALFIALFVASCILNVPNLVLGDPDTLWHIKVGSDIWRDLRLPVEDAYSFTFLGQRWIAKEWLAQLLLYCSWALGGWIGVVILSSLSIGVTAFLFCREIGKAANPRIAIIVTVIAFFLASPVFVGRPQILILPLAVAWTASLFRAAEERRPPSLLLLAILVAWSNLHGSFLLGIVVAGFAFLHFLETHGFHDRALLWRWTAFLAFCLPASFIHPYGIEPLVLAVNLSLGNEWVPMISEWLPFNARDKPVHEMGLLASLACLLWMRPRLSLSKIAFLLFALHMYLLHQRFVFVYMLLVPMAIIRDVIPQGSGLSATAWAKEPRDLMERFMISRLHPAAAALLLLIVVSSFALLRSSTEPPADVLTGKAIHFAQDNLLPGNVLNEYNFGGSLIFHGIPTFVDGRTDQLFLGEFATTLAATGSTEGAELFTRQLDQYRIGWTLLRKTDPRNQVLSSLSQWQRIYTDDQAVIYKRLAGNETDAREKSTDATSEIQ